MKDAATTPTASDLVSLDAAREAMLGAARPLGVEIVESSAALGRIIAERIAAEEDLVSFARSAMDGYALSAAQTANAPVLLPIAQTIYAAGGDPVHAPGTASAIATGAPLPHGADAVVPVEETARRGDVVEIRAAVEAGMNVFPVGDDARCGETIIECGSIATPGILGLLAAAGKSRLCVYRRPRVALVCSGDELVGVDERPRHGQIRNSNLPALCGLVLHSGAEVTFTTTVPDDPERLQRALETALEAADVVVTTGGASIGERDLVKRALACIGVSFAFTSVALRPSKPTAFGMRRGVRVAVLPGNPAAAFAAFVALVRPLLARLSGLAHACDTHVQARLDGTARLKPDRHYLMFGRLRITDGGLCVQPLPNQCSSLVRGPAAANALIVLPPGTATLVAGDRVDVDVINWAHVADGS